MSRGFGEAQFVSELSDAVVAAAGLVTQLGDMWFVLVALVTLVVGHRLGLSVTDDPWRDGLFLFALAVGSYSLTVALKHAFALPRPPGAATATSPSWLPALADSAYESMVTGDGYGFPSGHALKSAAVYGGAAVSLTAWSRRRRFAMAGVTIAAVALSRVVLGVHYLVDVLAGVLVGFAFLALAIRVTDCRPGRALVGATALGLLAFVASLSAKSALAAAAPLLGVVAWRYTERSARVGSDFSAEPVDSGDEL